MLRTSRTGLLSSSWFVLACCIGLATSLVAKAADPLDWPNWLGPQQNRTSIETGLADEFDPNGGAGSNLLWKNAELAGISTPIVMNGKLYTICRAEPGTPREGEKVVCADAATGKVLWENRFNVYLSDVPDTRVGWSSCLGDPETGRIYALGVCGLFQCLDGDTGKTIWSRSLHEEFGLLSTYGGRTNVPVIHEDLVIISAIVIGWGEMAKPAHRFLGLNKTTGEAVWFNGTRLLPDDTTYSTPVVTVLGGQAAIVFASGDGAIWAMQPRTGRGIWKYQLSQRGVNVSPLVVGDRVFASQSEENIDDNTMGAVVAIDALAKGPTAKTGEMDLTKSGELWCDKEIMSGKASPVMVDGRLISVTDGASLMVLDPANGDILDKTKVGRVMRSTPLVADGKIYTSSMNGYVYVLKLENDKIKTVSRTRLPAGEECHGSPIVSHGRIYIPTTGQMYCIADETKQPGAVDAPQPPAEAAGSDQAAQVQIVPAEVLLKPGDKQKFTVRLYNATGRMLQESPAEFSLAGPGEIDADGNFQAASGSAHTAAIVTAKVGDLTGQSRIRVVPDLPWKFDFEDGQVPVTWVGARYRHQIREMDGNKVMVKVTTIPKGTRSQAWMGQTDLSNYTIQADVRGAITDNKMPDIGLTAQRYTLDLRGASQELQIRSWPPVLRMAKTVKFPWKPDTWYTMKLKASLEEVGGKQVAVLRGKVWPKGEAEPDAWTVEATDEQPNLTGSPGLYGNAKDAELYLDNLTVTPN